VADGKSPIAGSTDPTRWIAVAVAQVFNTISFLFDLRIHRHSGSGRGTPSSADPLIRQLEEDGHRTVKLHGDAL
jgi:hypothetical protein